MFVGQQRQFYSDLDSPYRGRRKNLSEYIKKPNDNFRLQLIPKYSQQHHSVKTGPSSQMQRIELLREEKESPIESKLKNRISEQKRQKKVALIRQSQEPQQISRQNSMDTEFAYRLTSLQKCFDETRSIRLPYYHQTQNRLYENQKFLTELQFFKENLSQIKKKGSKADLFPSTERSNNIKKNRLSETRPKKLEIHYFENENVKKEKDKIFVEKLMKQKVDEYRDNLINWNQKQNILDNFVFQEQMSLSSQVTHWFMQIQNLSIDVEQMQMEIMRLRKLKKENKQKLREVTNFFSFLY